MRIKQIWEELKKDESFVEGLLFRRYSGTILPDVFIALQEPEKLFCVGIAISKNIDISISSFLNLQEINVDIVTNKGIPSKNVLLFKLINSQHEEIFAVLCEDLITSISNESDEKIIVRTILNRFEKWKSLFSKIGLQGLSPEEQRGLYGELYFLRKYLQFDDKHFSIINTWLGTEKGVKDFQNKNWALEVKTSHGNNHQKVHISSERQLDNTNLENLFLYHISLEQLQNSGENLNDIVDSVIDILNSDKITLNKFKSKIYEVGYFDSQRNLYDSIGYSIRQDIFYKVENEFPRIQENEVRKGVGDVKYSIILSQCQQYIKPENEVLEILSK